MAHLNVRRRSRVFVSLVLLGRSKEAAKQIGDSALRGWQSELCEGLNLGGGDYFKFTDGSVDVLLVCNDADRAEVFVESRWEFPYYCYVREGNDSLLERMRMELASADILSELDEEA